MSAKRNFGRILLTLVLSFGLCFPISGLAFAASEESNNISEFVGNDANASEPAFSNENESNTQDTFGREANAGNSEVHNAENTEVSNADNGDTTDVASPVTDEPTEGMSLTLNPASIPPADIAGNYVEGEVLITLDEQGAPGMKPFALEANNEDVLSDELTETLEVLDIQVVEEIPETCNGLGAVALAETPDNLSTAQAITALENLPGVASVQPNYIYELIDADITAVVNAAELAAEGATDSSPELSPDSVTTLPNDPLFGNSTQRQYYLYKAGVTSAWSQATCDGSVSVAVLDTGCRMDHADLIGNIDTVNAYDAHNKKPLTASSASYGDPAGHGTHVSGIVAAQANNAIGIAGSSYNAKVVPIKVFDDTGKQARSDTLVVAMRYLMDRMDSGQLKNLRVLNMSLGSYYGSVFPAPKNIDRELEAAIDKLKNSYNVLTVCSGGNGDEQTGTPRTGIVYPSDYDTCFSVTSLDADGGNSYWCDYNQYKDISTYGVNILSTYKNATDSYAYLSGTSMAAPLVSGSAALLCAANPGLTVDELRTAMTSTADVINDSENDRRGTSGSAGSLNVNKAVKQVAQSCSHRNLSDFVHDSVNHWKVCNDCGRRIDVTPHTFDSWTQVKDNLLVPGELKRTCGMCGFVQTRTVAAKFPQYAAYARVYDSDYYMTHNPDVRNAYKGNEYNCFIHFLNYGMNEGRRGNATFDVASYYNANLDLRRAFGTNLRALYNHYINNGYREGRTTTNVSSITSFEYAYRGVDYSRVYDGNLYYRSYSDLANAFLVRAGSLRLYNDAALIAHFVNSGMNEGRVGSNRFNPASYYNAYPDLRQAFGINPKSLYMHYVNNGAREGRSPLGSIALSNYISTQGRTSYASIYNGAYYYSHYRDLANVFTKRIGSYTFINDAALLNHFVSNGMSEGRQASSAFNVYTYKSRYPDLQRAFGSNLKSYYLHYKDYGLREGRTAA